MPSDTVFSDDIRRTVGSHAVELLSKPDEKVEVEDMRREMQKGYMDNIRKCIDDHRNWTNPWYVVVISKKETLLENVIRNYFIGRQSLPTPQWDQTVWRYYPSNGNLEFVWVLPDENTAKYLMAFDGELPSDQRQLQSFVIRCLNKTLYRDFFQKWHSTEPKIQESAYASLVATKGRNLLTSS